MTATSFAREDLMTDTILTLQNYALDEWKTEFRTTQTELGGFVGGLSTTETKRQRVDMPKLKRAARELADVAEKLGALSTFDASTPRTEISGDLIEDIDEWRQENIQT